MKLSFVHLAKLISLPRMLCLIAIVFTGGQYASAQTAAPGSSQAGASKYQLQLPVPLVVEDVVALDRNEQPVPGLKASDLAVTENGKPVTLRSFEEHAASAQPAGAFPKLPDLGSNVFTNIQPVPDNGALYVLLLDALNTPMSDQAYVRQQMLKYLKNLPRGMRIAVFGLGTRLYLLQGFSSDPDVLEAAIQGKRGKLRASPLLDDPVAGDPVEQMSDSVADTLGDSVSSDPNAAILIANMQQFEAETETTMARLREIYTLQAMDELARYLSAFPGRKNLIWFSGSFPLDIMPDDTLADPFSAVANFEDDVRKTSDLLAGSRVAVYPVDGRGLFTNPAFSASQRGANFMRNPSAFANANGKFFVQTAAEHATMDSIAESTGGQAFYNTNGLKEAVEKIARLGDNYYTVAYTPTDQKLDGRFRKIAIRCDQPGVHLEYRRGYFADNLNTKTQGSKVLPQNAMTVAMMRGGPDAAQLLFDAMVVPADATGNSTTEGTMPNPKLMKPPYRSYTVQFLVDLRGATFDTDDKGMRHGELEFATFLYDADGELVNSVDNALKLNLTADRYAQLASHGLMARLTIEAPVKGEYFLRMGVHDLASDRVGAIEIPVAGLKSWQELKAEAAKHAQQPAAK